MRRLKRIDETEQILNSTNKSYVFRFHNLSSAGCWFAETISHQNKISLFPEVTFHY
jgi:hypothetical protein